MVSLLIFLGLPHVAAFSWRVVWTERLKISCTYLALCVCSLLDHVDFFPHGPSFSKSLDRPSLCAGLMILTGKNWKLQVLILVSKPHSTTPVHSTFWNKFNSQPRFKVKEIHYISRWKENYTHIAHIAEVIAGSEELR